MKVLKRTDTNHAKLLYITLLNIIVTRQSMLYRLMICETKYVSEKVLSVMEPIYI